MSREYLRSDEPWYVGFSGGKDSTAVLKLVYSAMKRSPRHERQVVVVYCDTGVEIPPIAQHVRRTLAKLRAEASGDSLNLRVRVARPPRHDSFFVKIIGRGYPPPTNKFRWCTDRLRINPVTRVLRSCDNGAGTVVLGTRRGESVERDKVLARHQLRSRYFYSQGRAARRVIFAPVADFTTHDIWSCVLGLDRPRAVDAETLAGLYRDADGECPMVRDEHGPPCGAGRFGCWTCTVIRRDRSVGSLIREGYESLRPLRDFRDWLSQFREDPRNRCRYRRNGQKGMGPFTLAARKKILARLRQVERSVPWRLLPAGDVKLIHELWAQDRACPEYRE